MNFNKVFNQVPLQTQTNRFTDSVVYSALVEVCGVRVWAHWQVWTPSNYDDDFYITMHMFEPDVFEGSVPIRHWLMDNCIYSRRDFSSVLPEVDWEELHESVLRGVIEQ